MKRKAYSSSPVFQFLRRLNFCHRNSLKLKSNNFYESPSKDVADNWGP